MSDIDMDDQGMHPLFKLKTEAKQEEEQEAEGNWGEIG